MLKKWEDLPRELRNKEVKKYYDILITRKKSIVLKRIFDFVVACIALFILLPVFIIISILIKIDSKGPIFYKQTRVTQYGKRFKILKFRTMVNHADKIGPQITTYNDDRITRVGKLLRRLKLDEIPQLINIILGDMSFVGTRPEVIKYVEKYTPEMMATLLLPSGVTSEASIQYRNEELLLESVDDVDKIYIQEVLPKKMEYNLKSIEKFSFFGDIKIMIRTLFILITKGKSTKVGTKVSKTDKSEVSM